MLTYLWLKDLMTAEMKKAFFIQFIFAALVSLSLISCTRSENVTDQEITVVVSILPYADFVEKVGGGRFDVKVMIPPGASPATYEPTPRQMTDLEAARLYIKVGAHLPFEDAWLDRILSPAKNITVVDASEGISIIDRDPHIWLSPRLVKRQVSNICRGLVSVDPDNTVYYERNRDVYLAELDALDREIREELSGLSDRRFMIFHPSFGYYAADYDLEQIPIEHEGKEPGPRDLAGLIDEARSKNIRVIFAAPQFRTKDAEVIADSIGGSVVLVDPLALDCAANLRRVTESLRQTMERK